MIAEQGKHYAQIKNGRVHWRFTAEQLPEWNENDIQVVECLEEVKEGWLYDGQFSEPQLSLQEKLALYEAAVDAHILRQAKSMGYNSVESCISYLGDENTRWDGEARAMKAWRSACWLRCQEILNQGVDPGSPQALIDLLPVWS